MMIGSQSLMLVLGVVLLLFGGKKLPELAGALGKSMKEFKKSVESPGTDSEPAPPAPPAPPTSIQALEARGCTGCKAMLQPEWTYCPACGATVKREGVNIPSAATP